MGPHYCHDCGRPYGDGGGHCASCCESFASDTAFDGHRYGDYDDQRYCLTAEEMLLKGWRVGPKGWTSGPPMTDEQRARARAREGR